MDGEKVEKGRGDAVVMALKKGCGGCRKRVRASKAMRRWSEEDRLDVSTMIMTKAQIRERQKGSNLDRPATQREL